MDEEREHTRFAATRQPDTAEGRKPAATSDSRGCFIGPELRDPGKNVSFPPDPRVGAMLS